MPTGWIASLRRPGTSKEIVWTTAFLTGSITDTLPPTSDDTQSSAPSGLNSAKRGREGTRMFATACLEAQSIRWAMLVVSDVLTTMAPSGLTATPSGSTPTGIWATCLREAMSIAVSAASSSLAANTVVPSGLRRNCSGSRPDGRSPTILKDFVSMIWIVSSSPAQTNRRASSFDSAIPRGRCPTLIVPVTAIAPVSMTETELPFSLVTKAV